MGAAALVGACCFVRPHESVGGAGDRDLEIVEKGRGVCFCKGRRTLVGPPKCNTEYSAVKVNFGPL